MRWSLMIAVSPRFAACGCWGEPDPRKALWLCSSSSSNPTGHALPMSAFSARLFLVAAPALLAGLWILSISKVDGRLWTVQLAAISLALVIAAAATFATRLTRSTGLMWLITGVTLLGLAAPLLSDRPGPDRWLSVGPLNLYMAPVLLPAFLVACASVLQGHRPVENIAYVTLVGVCVLIALQPDVSQVLAMLVGAGVIVAKLRRVSLRSIAALLSIALAAACAFAQPDLLEPVAYVELVFSLALSHSIIAGVGVIATAVALLLGLQISGVKGSAGLSGAAGYYAVLFACSILGTTPAPLIGYGAGPILGFGLMVAVARWHDAMTLERDLR